MKKALVTGANGQIGSDLVAALQGRLGPENVLATDLYPASGDLQGYEQLDVLDVHRFRELIEDHEPDTVFHLASLLSGTGESRPQACWEINATGLRNVLELAATSGFRVFWPSSIAVFGPESRRGAAPQTAALQPTTMYGVTKVASELLCRYYAERFNIDVRSVRFPGIISYSAPPGGGTTDYAVDIFRAALEKASYTCFVRADTRLPMMYMPDAIRSILRIMEAEAGAITVRTSYNIGAVSFSAAELAAEIRRHMPEFECRYEPDHRQQIADSWPREIDDSCARRDWGWTHEYELTTIVEDMLHKLGDLLAADAPAGPGYQSPSAGRDLQA